MKKQFVSKKKLEKELAAVKRDLIKDRQLLAKYENVNTELKRELGRVNLELTQERSLKTGIEQGYNILLDKHDTLKGLIKAAHELTKQS